MKSNSLQFFYNTTPTDCFSNNGTRKTHWVEHKLSSIKFRSTEDNKVNTLSEMTVKEFFKHLTKCGFGADTTIGKTIRNAIKLSLAQLITTEFTETLMNDKFYFYLDAATSDVIMLKAKEVEHQNNIIHEAFIITRKEDKAGVSVYMSLGKQFNSISKDRKSMMIKTDFSKVETRGRKARKVEAVITVNSTLEENNAATVEHIEKFNEVVEIVNVVVDEVADLKAEIAAMKAEREAEKAELAQLKVAMNPTQELIKAMQPRTGSIFARPVATAKQEAMLDLEAIKAVPFTFDSTEIERL
ncbi:hypothetical protein MM182_18910 [Aeromonas sp. MR19]|uniref:hypothetical protein n=1 Tax=Aeromonas sp. MR19 TaxID=2923421 RepID=UPI001F4A903E|nr:hypothetical protein [Aeromonas sp. MR19]MCH7377426.1 hypothetical protein [Aeromonas sp. MR19]